MSAEVVRSGDRLLACVVRASGERTAGLCRSLLGTQCPDAAMVQVGGMPFPETLAAGLRAGVELGCEWTLCVDADVLPIAGAVEALLSEASGLDPSMLEIQPLVFDRFFGGWRPAGVHLYRTSVVPRALQELEHAAASIRPETALLERMAAAGFGWGQSAVEFGLHDFEQAPRDVYRKSFVHARKHGDLRSRLERYWRERAPMERDFSIALDGLAAGEAHAGPIALDVNADYLRYRCEPDAPGDDIAETYDVVRALETEELALARLPEGVAPVWDWIESVWADREQRRRTTTAFVRSILEYSIEPIMIEHVDARTRLLVRIAAEWGLPVAGIIGDPRAMRSSLCAVPLMGEPASALSGAVRVRRTGDGRFLARVGDREITEPLACDLPQRECAPSSADAVAGVLDRLRRRGVDRVVIYGAGALGVETARAFRQRGRVLAFVESDPVRAGAQSELAPVLRPEDALAVHAGADIVIASLGSARAMVRRLLAAAVASGCRPGRIWLLDTP